MQAQDLPVSSALTPVASRACTLSGATVLTLGASVLLSGEREFDNVLYA